MKKIKSIIVRYLCITAAIVSILIVILASFLLVRREQQMTVLSTKSMFMQVEHLLEAGLPCLKILRSSVKSRRSPMLTKYIFLIPTVSYLRELTRNTIISA